jgi:Uncharacterized protein conserved in bacteria (DUF2188)
MPDVHVVPQGSDWGLEVGGEIRSTHETQREAIREGAQLAAQEQGELVIHGFVRRTATGTTRKTSPASPVARRASAYAGTGSR